MVTCRMAVCQIAATGKWVTLAMSATVVTLAMTNIWSVDYVWSCLLKPGLCTYHDMQTLAKQRLTRSYQQVLNPLVSGCPAVCGGAVKQRVLLHAAVQTEQMVSESFPHGGLKA